MGEALPRREPRPRSLKRRLSCKQWLPIGCFDRKKGSPDYHSTECKACKGERKEPTRLVREEKLRIAIRALLSALDGHNNSRIAAAKNAAARLVGASR